MLKSKLVPGNSLHGSLCRSAVRPWMYRSGALSTDLNGYAQSHWVAENHIQEKPLGNLHLMVAPHLTFPPPSSSYRLLHLPNSYHWTFQEINSQWQSSFSSHNALAFVPVAGELTQSIPHLVQERQKSRWQFISATQQLHPPHTTSHHTWPVLSPVPHNQSRTRWLCASRLNVLFWLHSSFLHSLGTPHHGQNTISRFEHWEEKCIHGNQSRSRWGLLYPRCIWIGTTLLERMPEVHSCQWSLAQPLHRRWVSAYYLYADDE